MSDAIVETKLAAGSELAKEVGIHAWPKSWPLPKFSGSLARHQLREHILKDVDRRLAAVLPAAHQGEPAARAAVEVLARVVRPLCSQAADLLERDEPARMGVARLLTERRNQELQHSMESRWELAQGPPLPIDEIWPLLEPRHRLRDLAHWLEQCNADQDAGARIVIRHHLDAMWPAEVAVGRLGVPVERAQRAREEALGLLDASAPLADVGRAAEAVCAAWETLRPRLIGLKPFAPSRKRIAPIANPVQINEGPVDSKAVELLLSRVLGACLWVNPCSLGSALAIVFRSPSNEEEDELEAVTRADDSPHDALEALSLLMARTLNRRTGPQREACLVALVILVVKYGGSAARKLKAIAGQQLQGLSPEVRQLRDACLRGVVARREANEAPDQPAEALILAQSEALLDSLEAVPRPEVPSSSAPNELSGPGRAVVFEGDRPLGKGADGEVWQGRDGIRSLAIKLFPGGEEAMKRALEHARALARVDHPNVVKPTSSTPFPTRRLANSSPALPPSWSRARRSAGGSTTPLTSPFPWRR